MIEKGDKVILLDPSDITYCASPHLIGAEVEVTGLRPGPGGPWIEFGGNGRWPMSATKKCCGTCKCSKGGGRSMGNLKPDAKELHPEFSVGERVCCLATGESGEVSRKTYHFVFVELDGGGGEGGFRPMDLEHEKVLDHEE